MQTPKARKKTWKLRFQIIIREMPAAFNDNSSPLHRITHSCDIHTFSRIVYLYFA